VNSTAPEQAPTNDDEAAARRVEAHVIAAALGRAAATGEPQPGVISPPTPVVIQHSTRISLSDADASAEASALQGPLDATLWATPPAGVDAKAEAYDPWGGLPAPWEPLPGWLASPTAFVTTTDAAGLNGPSGNGYGARLDALYAGSNGTGGDHANTGSAGAFSGPGGTGGGRGGNGGNGTGGGAGAAGDGGGAPAGAHFAPYDRSLEAPATTPTVGQAPDPHAQGQSEPDLDALAHQVYIILKRRLASERRRLG
jgi:hypothetical protein